MVVGATVARRFVKVLRDIVNGLMLPTTSC
jgi:hypothetical protein